MLPDIGGEVGGAEVDTSGAGAFEERTRVRIFRGGKIGVLDVVLDEVGRANATSINDRGGVIDE